MNVYTDGGRMARDLSRWWPRSLRARVVMIVLTATLPMLALAIHEATEDRRREAKEAEQNAVRLAAVIGLEEKRLLDQTRVLLVDLSHRRDVAADRRPECDSVLAHAREHFQRYDNLAVIELDGTVSCSAVPAKGRINVADRGYFRKALETADFAFGSYERERVTGRPALIFAFPIMNRANKPIRVVTAAVDLRRLSTFEETVAAQLPVGASITKIDGSGRILALAPYAPDRIGTSAWAVHVLRPLVDRGSGVVRMPDASGVPHLYAAARAPYSLQAGEVGVILAIPEDIAFQEIDHTLERALLALSALTLLVVIATWLVTRSTIARPLEGLLAATRRVASGEFDLRLGPLHSAGELGLLARSFDEMAEALQARDGDLTRSEARYRSLFENAPYGVFTTDTNGRFLEVNPAFARILGHQAASELVGKASTPFYELTEQREALVKRLREQGVVQGVEVRLKRPDGKSVLVRGAGRLVRDQHGTVIAHEVIVEDVTEQRALEEQFRQAQKLEAVGRLAGGVAHDFNNLLTVILGYADLVRGELTASLQADFGEITKSALRAKALTQQLLAFSRRQLLEAEPINLNHVLEGTEKMLRRLIGEDVELVASFEPELGTVTADRGQIEQVVMNLAVNARDAMPRGGRLVIETRNEDLTSSVQHEGISVPPGRYVTLSVADTGVGMSDETKARLFEPFFTTKEHGKGTGLGLATVYGIVKQSAGSISVHSATGKGTTFKIYLPRIDEPAADALPAQGHATVSGSGERVLLVEDDDSVRAVTQKILATHGYEVLQARSGEEALELAKRVRGDIDLLLTDVVLPVMSGPELAARLLTERPAMKVLYASGYVPETASQLVSLGAGVSFLQKPFTADALLLKIHDALRKHI